jgi:hypothetical protein
VGDTYVRVTGNIQGRAGGLALGGKGLTVYWFSDELVKAARDGAYAAIAADPNKAGSSIFWVPGQKSAVQLSAQASIQPAGLDPTAPELKNLSVGLAQNGIGTYSTYYTNPIIVWDNPAANPNVQVGVTATTGTLLDDITKVPLVGNDANQQNAPLYGPSVPFLNFPGGKAFTSNDTPFIEDLTVRSGVANTAPPNPVAVGTYKYRMTRATMALSFADWAVVFDSATGAMIPLRETHWTLNVDSDNLYERRVARCVHLSRR